MFRISILKRALRRVHLSLPDHRLYMFAVDLAVARLTYISDDIWSHNKEH